MQLLAASINLIPLLLGGRTSRLADVIGLSRSSYYLAHHWIGRTAIVEALLHAVIGSVQAANAHTFDPVAISGCIVSLHFRAKVHALTAPGGGKLLLHPRSDVAVVETQLGVAFRAVHRILYLVGMAGLVWHVLLVQSLVHEILVFIACDCGLHPHIVRVVTRWRSVTVLVKLE